MERHAATPPALREKIGWVVLLKRKNYEEWEPEPAALSTGRAVSP
jgi:hypothetical protein